MRERSTLILLLICFFLSGLAALIYQTAWTRQFAFVFGTSELAVATVLAAYMAGLALGAAVGAKLAPRIERPILAYALLELGVAVTALAVPLAIELSMDLYVALFSAAGMVESTGTAFTSFYLLCSLIILIVPTALMGATLPLLIRHAVRRREEIGARVSVLYGANTVGAVAGTLLAGFALLPTLGLQTTVWIAVAVNVLVFVAAVALSRGVEAPTAGEDATVPALAGSRRWILPAILLSGVCSFTYEVLWTRLLAHVLGGSVYAFAIMLATFLSGIALGALAAGRFASTPVRAATAFGWAQFGTAVLSVAAYVGVDWLPALVRNLSAGIGTNSTGDAIVAGLVLLPSTICIGATFPLAVRVLAERETDAAPVSARVYAWNTVGAIVGALGAGFFAIPALGYALSLSLAVALNLALAAGSVWLLPGVSRRVWVAAGAMAVLMVLVRVQPPWGVLLSSIGGSTSEAGQVIDYAVGRSATVLTLEQPHGFQLRTNGLTEAEILRRGERAAIDEASHWLGLMPVLARPDARSLFSIGLGGGVAIEDLPKGLERIDVVELEPRVVDANRNVGPLRRSDPLADPRVNVAVNDARATLLLTDQRYDGIISQPSHPWVAGAAHLYTRDFFELVRSRLTEDGVFVQWMGSQFIDVELLQTLVATLRSVFPHVRVYSPLPPWAVLFVASEGPLDIESTSQQALADSPEIFESIGLRSADDVRTALMFDEENARRFSEGATINTDDHNLLQMRSPRVLARYRENQAALLAALLRHDPLSQLASDEDFSYAIRRLVLEQQAERALRLASAHPDVRVTTRSALLVRALAGQVGPEALERALADHPNDPELRAVALIRAAAGTGPPPTARRRQEQLYLDAAGLAREGRFAALRELDAELAGFDVRDPLHDAAARLRIAWRIESGEPERAQTALRLVAPLLAAWPQTSDLTLRVRAAVAAEDPATALAAIRELVLRPDASPEQLVTAAEALGRVQVAESDRMRRSWLFARLEERGARAR